MIFLKKIKLFSFPKSRQIERIYLKLVKQNPEILFRILIFYVNFLYKKCSKPRSKHIVLIHNKNKTLFYWFIKSLSFLSLANSLFLHNLILLAIFIHCGHCIRSLNHLQRSTLLPLFPAIRLAKWKIVTVLSQSRSQGNLSPSDETIKNNKVSSRSAESQGLKDTSGFLITRL